MERIQQPTAAGLEGLIPLPQRAEKPRSSGVTHVIDPGLTCVEATGLMELASYFTGSEVGLLASAFARTIGRAALAACYALVVVRIVRDHRELPRWLRPLRDAGRMPLSNYLLQTALATFVFYGWGLGLWNSAGPGAEIGLAIVLFVAVQLPLSHAWLTRFRYGPLEYLWRRFTYGSAPR